MKSFEYSVVPLGDLVESRKWFSLARTRIDHIASSLTQGLNNKDSEGWELVSIHATMGDGFAVFKRERTE